MTRYINVGCAQSAEHGLSVSSSVGTLEEATAFVEREMQYWRSLGYDTAEVVYAEETCRACNGNGTVQAKSGRLFATRKCPICHGKPNTIDVLSAIQKERMSYRFREERERIASELNAARQRQDRFGKLYQSFRDSGMTDTDAHEKACRELDGFR